MHSGHRERIKDRFLEEGLDHFEPHQILELVLFYAIPQKDTNLLAHRLLERFDGSISRVFDASVEELMVVDGIGKNAAVLLKLFPEVCRRYLLDANETGRVIKSSDDAAKLLLPRYIGKKNELVTLICLDSRGKVIFFNDIFQGSIHAAAVSVRRIVEVCVRSNTADVLIAHNHPGGVAVPSEQDVHVTRKIAEALHTIGVSLLDHIIVAGNDWVSLAATPTLSSLFAPRDNF